MVAKAPHAADLGHRAQAKAGVLHTVRGGELGVRAIDQRPPAVFAYCPQDECDDFEVAQVEHWLGELNVPKVARAARVALRACLADDMRREAPEARVAQAVRDGHAVLDFDELTDASLRRVLGLDDAQCLDG